MKESSRFGLLAGLAVAGTAGALYALGFIFPDMPPNKKVVEDSIKLTKIEYFVNPERKEMCVYNPQGELGTVTNGEAGITIIGVVKDKDYIKNYTLGWGDFVFSGRAYSRELSKSRDIFWVNDNMPLSHISQPFRVIVHDWSNPAQTQTKEFTWDYMKANGKIVGFPKPASGCPKSIDDIAK